MGFKICEDHMGWTGSECSNSPCVTQNDTAGFVCCGEECWGYAMLKRYMSPRNTYESRNTHNDTYKQLRPVAENWMFPKGVAPEGLYRRRLLDASFKKQRLRRQRL